MRKNSKTNDVYQHLIKYGRINTLEAIRLYGATRLSAIIFNLRKDYKIETKIKTDVNRYGDKVHYGQYIYGGKYGE